MSNTKLPPETEAIRRECYAILGAIAKKPQAAKLLPGVRDALRAFLNYKQGRSRRWQPPPNPDGDCGD